MALVVYEIAQQMAGKFIFTVRSTDRGLSCCRKKVCNEINSDIIIHTKFRQGFSVIEHVCSNK